MKKIISVLLVVFLLLGAVGCSKNKPNDSDIVSDQVATEFFMLEQGSTNYVVVMPQDPTSAEESAKSELTLLFKEATGISLPVIADTGLTHNADNKYISIGNTALLASSNVEISTNGKTKNGFQISTKDKTIYLIGGADNGVLMGTYEFLFRILNFEQFSADCYSLDKAVTEIPLYDFNVSDAPDFPNHKAFTGYLNRDRGVALRMRAVNQFNIEKSPPGSNGAKGHNTLEYSSSSKNKELHPKWYSYPDNSQLCYVARGDEAEKELLIQQVVENVKITIRDESQRDKWVLAITGEDNKSVCSCEECLELRDKYNCNTAQYIWFMNEVCDRTFDWLENDEEGKQYYTDDFRFKVSFYEEYTDAPAKYDETSGEWVPIDETVVLRDKIEGSIAPIHADFQRPITDEVNKVYYTALLKVAAVTNEMATWWYATNFAYYMFPFDNFSSMQPNYQTLYEMGVSEFLDETQNGNNGGMTGFHMFKSYLSCRLAYDVYESQAEMTDRFFKGYFMDAAEDMRKYYDSYRNFSQIQMNGLCPGMGSIYYHIAKAEYWPKVVIDEWQGYVESAMQKIEKYKILDPDTYEMLYKHISMERVFLDYCYINFYKENIKANLRFYQERFVADFRLNDITLTKEGNYRLEDYAETLLKD